MVHSNMLQTILALLRITFAASCFALLLGRNHLVFTVATGF
jgi:hypothetical protein